MSKKEEFLLVPIHKETRKPNLGGRPRKWTPIRIGLERKALIEWLKIESNYFIGSFLAERGLTRPVVDKMRSYDKRFSYTWDMAQQIQEKRLVEMAVSKKGNSDFIKFVLQNKAGWKERSEVSGEAANPLSIVLSKIADNAREPIEGEVELINEEKYIENPQEP